MEMHDVDSSNVAQVGYDADAMLLRVRFKSGGTYDYPDTSLETWQALQRAPSVGRFVSTLRGSLYNRLQNDVPLPASPESAASREGLTSYQPDECCSKHLAKVIEVWKSDSWTCPVCGGEWRARMIEGIRHWEPYELIEVFALSDRVMHSALHRRHDSRCEESTEE